MAKTQKELKEKNLERVNGTISALEARKANLISNHEKEVALLDEQISTENQLLEALNKLK